MQLGLLYRQAHKKAHNQYLINMAKQLTSEQETNWNVIENAIINFLKENTKILNKRVQAKDIESTKSGLDSIISGLVNAQRSLNLVKITDTTYNGWTNYATWCINLELLDGSDISDFYPDTEPDVFELADFLETYVLEILEHDNANELCLSYATAFISGVNWNEIATHLIEG